MILINRIPRSYFALLLSLTLIISMMPSVALASNTDDLSETITFTFSKENLTDGLFTYSGTKGQHMTFGGKSYFQPKANKTITFNITLQEEGYYKITRNWYNTGGNVTTKINGTTIENKKTYTSLEINNDTLIGILVKLNSGENTITITPSGSECFHNMTFTPLKDASIYVGDKAWTEDSTYPRGTDTLSVEYEYEIDDTTLGNVSLYNNTKECNTDIDVSLSDDGDTLVVALTETLDYDNSYTLNLTDLKSSFGTAVPSYTASFNTSKQDEEDKGESTVTINNAYIDGNMLVTEGTVSGSIGQGISGREVHIYSKLSDSDEEFELLGETLTLKEDTDAGIKTGDFTLSVSFENMETGYYDVKAVTEYYETGSLASDPVYYVSQDTLRLVLADLKATTTLSEVESFFASDYNSKILNLGEISANGLTAEEFYPFLIGTDVSDYPSFIKAYNCAVALGSINKATDGSKVGDVIENETYNDALDIDNSKLNVLTETLEQFYDYIADCRAFSNHTEFNTAFNDAFNKSLVLQEDIESIILSSPVSQSVNIGQQASYVIKAQEEFTNVRQITLTVDLTAFDGMYTSVNVTSDLGNTELWEKDNIITVQIKVKKLADSHSEIAEVTLCPTSTGSYTFAIGGEAVFKATDDYDVNVAIIPANATVSATKKKSNGGGGGGVSFGGGSKPITNVTELPAVSPDTEKFPDYDTNTMKLNDISYEHWAGPAVNYLINRSIVSEPVDGNFYPDRFITRAEFLKMMVHAKQLYIWNAINKFNDVNEDDWFYKHVLAGINNKIITGDENNNFNPNALITREDMCVMLDRLLKKNAEEITVRFADDEQISEYAVNAVYNMMSLGIVNGVGENTFAPKENATRAMAAKMIYTMLKEVN